MIILLFSCTIQKKSIINHQNSVLQYVNPFIGTGSHGHTYPGASSPFGMMQLSPDTRLEGWDGCSGYHYSDNYIYGFSHTHLSGTGVSDYGDVLIMPTTGDLLLTNGYNGEKGYRSQFSHDKEIARPAYYSVYLEDYNINVDLTVSKRSGFHKYVFPKNENAQIILDLEHRDKLTNYNIELIDENTIQGIRYSEGWAENQKIHFYIKLSKSIIETIYRSDSLVVGYKFGKLDDPLLLKIGISAVSEKNAKENLEKEIPHWDFEKTMSRTQKEWEKELNKIIIKTPDIVKKEIFYTALYHSFLNPNLFSDINGDYLGTDLKVHNSREKQYTVFSLWDTFRATHPLFTIIQRKKTSEFIKTFLRQYKDGGKLPVWELAGNYTGCMIGYHSIPVITDAYVKGIIDFDHQLALEGMQESANKDHLGLKYYKKNGFISSSNEPESVSKTLEYAYDDWCIGEYAKLIGKDSIADLFYERAQNYKNIFDPGSNFFRAKSNYSWFTPFDPTEVNFNYTEANAWQYSMFVPQDIQGHINLMGGKKKYEDHLDKMFNSSSETSGRKQVDITGLIGQYAHGNEPSHHIAYLYNYIGKPYKTQERIKQILSEQYSNLPEGLSGNEDCGQMSSWYVLSSLGFYSVTPGLDYYTIGTPLFDTATIYLENGNIFQIIANNVSDENIYIQSARLNNTEYTKSYLNHSDIMNGGKIIFEMGGQKSNWGNKELPYSHIKNNKIIPVPYFLSASKTFNNDLKIEIGCLEDCIIYFTTDGSEPNKDSDKYYNPISITSNTTIKAICIKKNKKSKVASANFYKIDNTKNIYLENQYENQYAASGEKTLIDNLRGGNNYRTGDWQGYREDLKVIVDIGDIRNIEKISLGCLQDIKSWIFFPKEIEIYTSIDNKTFDHLTTIKNTFPDNKEGSFIKDFTYNKKKIKAQYVKIIAKQYGLCPEWHLGAGGKTWIFSDEITIE